MTRGTTTEDGEALALLVDGLPKGSRHVDCVWQVDWLKSSNDGPLFLASCSSDPAVRIHSFHGPATPATSEVTQDANNNNNNNNTLLTPVQQLADDYHKRTIRSLAFSNAALGQGRFLATASFDATVQIWQRTQLQHSTHFSLQHLATLEGHENEVKSVAWSHTSPLLATCGRDKSVWIWECDEDDDFQCLAVLQEHTQDVKMVRWNPQQDMLVSASYDNSIRVWMEVPEEDDEWACIQVLQQHTSTVWAVDFSPDGQYLVSVGDDRALCLWQWSAREKQFSLLRTWTDYHARSIYSVAWLDWQGCAYVASAGGDNNINIMRAPQTEDPKVWVHSSAHPCDINCVQWAPASSSAGDAPLLASCSDDGLVRIWKLLLR